MKKFVIPLLVISMLMLGLAVFADTTVQLPAYNGPAVTLTFWSWVPGLDHAIALFEKAYPNIKINWTNVGTGQAEYNKLLTSLSAGSGAPDIVQIEYDMLPTFISYGGLVDLNKYGANNYKSLFVPWTWNQVSQSNAVYAIPQDTGPYSFAYNKAIFDKYGLTVPKTWDEYAADAQKLYEASNGKVVLGNFDAGGTGNIPWLIGLVWAAGGHWWELQGSTWVQTINSPTTLKVVNFWGNLISKGYISTYAPWTTDWYNAMSEGKVASIMSPAWMPALLQGNLSAANAGQWRMAPLPQWPNMPFTSGNWGGSTDAVTIQSKYPQAAFIFALWLNTNEQACVLDNQYGGLFPASYAGLEAPALHDTTTAIDQFFGGQDVNQLSFDASKAVNTDFAWAPWLNYVYNESSKDMNDAISGKISWTQAFDQLQNASLNYAQSQGFNVK
jgi:multiple sugar transport system substrate-binding protein